MDDHKEGRGCWTMKDEALDRNVWTTQLGRGYRRVVRENTERVNPEGTLVACYWTVFFLGLATNIAEGFFFYMCTT